MGKNVVIYILLAVFTCALASCTDDENFTIAEGDEVTFSVDTIKFDTVFANVPSITKSFWIFNHTGHGLRFNSVGLAKGAKSEFRVNIDGEYLGQSNNYTASDIEMRKGDSLRVFVELTAVPNSMDGPQPVDEDLLLNLGNGSQQKVHLSAYSWNADMLHNMVIANDTTLGGNGRPIVVYGDMKIDSLATLTIKRGTTLYFHSDAGLQVYGKLLLQGSPDSNVILRGDRLDWMFDYLPYDRVPGQWKGIRFYEHSYANELIHADIHSSFDGIVIDSSDTKRSKLVAEGLTVHNCQGYGIYCKNSQITLRNSQISNTLKDCIYMNGGLLNADHCTIAQFYPFTSPRGYALRLEDNSKEGLFNIKNSLITGYDDNVLLVPEQKDTTESATYAFEYCVLRTPQRTSRDSVCFKNVLFENVKDTTSMGEKHFVLVSLDKQKYDFHLSKSSSAIGYANLNTSLPYDHDGYKRDDKPDVGAYEYRPDAKDGNNNSTANN